MNDGLALDRPYRLHPKAALRDEPFGALAYHYGNRRLVFLKSRRLVALVRDLEHQPTLDAALTEHAPDDRPQYLRAVENLARADVIRPRGEDADGGNVAA
jgi:putative mycofactocin binding protein MftB